jgi:hypothetical protein
MRKSSQRSEAVLQDFVAWYSGQRRYKPYTAGFVFEARVYERSSVCSRVK